MLEFNCDICGSPISREEAVQIRLIPQAYVPEGPGEPVVGELCHWCARFFETTIMGQKLGEAGSASCTGIIEQDSQKNDETISEIKKNIGRTKNPLGEGRCITIARIRAGLTQYALGKLCCVEQATVSAWENNRAIPDWTQLEEALAELPKIRETGCAAYCGRDGRCAAIGICHYSRYRVNNEEFDRGKNL